MPTFDDSRREAPAPAEGVKQQSDEAFDIEETRRENADNVRTLDAIAEFVGCPHDEELTVNHVRAHYATRPDTAEARLRELLNGRDDFIVSKGLWTEFTDTLPRTPGGDKAKESEGGVEGHAGNAETVNCKESHFSVASKPVEAGIKPGPSEPSPPADRREIVAEWPALKKAIWRVVIDEKLNDGHYINAYDLTDKLYRAALDGGRDA